MLTVTLWCQLFFFFWPTAVNNKDQKARCSSFYSGCGCSALSPSRSTLKGVFKKRICLYIVSRVFSFFFLCLWIFFGHIHNTHFYRRDARIKVLCISSTCLHVCMVFFSLLRSVVSEIVIFYIFLHSHIFYIYSRFI